MVMTAERIDVMAKKVASILAENEATLGDMEDVFKRAKEHLFVVYRAPSKIGISNAIIVREHPDNSNRIGDK